MTMYVAAKEYKRYRKKIRENLVILHQNAYPKCRNTLVRESYLSSSMLIMDDYMNLSNIHYSNERRILGYIMGAAVACWWIVDKFEAEVTYTAKCLAKITNINWRYIVYAESHILKILNYHICKYMHGQHAASPKHTENMEPVFEEIKSCLFRLKSSNVSNGEVATTSTT